MQTKTAFIWVAVILIAMVLGTAWVYPHLPETMTIHWGFHNQPNGTAPRWLGAWVLPGASMLLLIALWWLLPVVDPLRESYTAFRPVYNAFIVGLVAALAYFDALTLLWNLGYPVPIARALAPALGGVFFLVGVLLRAAQPNWFVGIRTPWTLSSPTVWRKTHQLAAPLFIASGGVTTFGVFWEPLLWYGVALALLVSAFVIGYSYWAYKAESHQQPRRPISRDKRQISAKKVEKPQTTRR